MNWDAVRAYSAVLLASAAGIAGMGIVFNAATDGNLHAMSLGVPPLLIGLWWAGRELARSMTVHRARKAALTAPTTRAVDSSQLTAHSSQLTAHSSQLTRQ
jgi:hypothetical protein